MYSRTSEVAWNFAWLPVVPWKSNFGFLTALEPRAPLSAATVRRLMACDDLRERLCLARERALHHGFAVEGRLEVLEGQREVEDIDVARRGRRSERGKRTEDRSAAGECSQPDPGLAQERCPRLRIDPRTGFLDRPVDIDGFEV